MADLQAMDVKDDWYIIYQDRREWFAMCQEGIEATRALQQTNMCQANSANTDTTLPCPCGRMFWRKDLTRHHRFCDSTNAAL